MTTARECVSLCAHLILMPLLWCFSGSDPSGGWMEEKELDVNTLPVRGSAKENLGANKVLKRCLVYCQWESASRCGRSNALVSGLEGERVWWPLMHIGLEGPNT